MDFWSNKRYIKPACKHKAFTLVEILIAAAIIALISALTVPMVVTKFQNTVMEKAYKKQITSITNMLEELPTKEGVNQFTDTYMYLENEPSDYSASSGRFLKNNFKISKYCSDRGAECFAPTYWQYTKSEGRKRYEPSFEGSCAILRNDMSICIKPQIAAKPAQAEQPEQPVQPVQGWIDINGPKGPNVFGRDLRQFSMDARTVYTLRVGGTSDVEDTLDCNQTSSYNQKCCGIWAGDPNLRDKLPQEVKNKCCQDLGEDNEICKPAPDECAENPVTLECCKKRAIANHDDPCCKILTGSDRPATCKDPNCYPMNSSKFSINCCFNWAKDDDENLAKNGLGAKCCENSNFWNTINNSPAYTKKCKRKEETKPCTWKLVIDNIDKLGQSSYQNVKARIQYDSCGYDGRSYYIKELSFDYSFWVHGNTYSEHKAFNNPGSPGDTVTLFDTSDGYYTGSGSSGYSYPQSVQFDNCYVTYKDGKHVDWLTDCSETPDITTYSYSYGE